MRCRTKRALYPSGPGERVCRARSQGGSGSQVTHQGRSRGTGVLWRLLEAGPSAGGGRAAALDETEVGAGRMEPTDPEAHGDSLAEGQLQGHPATSSTELLLDKRTSGFCPHSWACERAWLVPGVVGVEARPVLRDVFGAVDTPAS